MIKTLLRKGKILAIPKIPRNHLGDHLGLFQGSERRRHSVVCMCEGFADRQEFLI